MTAQETLALFVEELPESGEIEFKSGANGQLPADIWKTIAAFSNTDGGRIIFGVGPDGKKINLSRNAIDRLQLDLISLCKEGFNCTIVPEVISRDGILVIDIPPAAATLRPIYSRSRGQHKGAYVRIGSSNHQANDEQLKRFTIAAKGGAEITAYEGKKYYQYFDQELINEFIKILNSKKNNIYQKFSEKEILIKQKAINDNEDVTLFGLLAFGKDLVVQEIVAPTINIAVTHYPGISKVDENDLSVTYLDNKEFDGGALEQFNQAFTFIKSKLPIQGTIDSNGKRRDYLIIPEIALREALANAIAHRDYSAYSSRVQVDIFSDRLEIINPGVSLVPIEQLDTAPSSTRNPLLMGYLKEIGGITEQKARGIRTIKISLQKAGLLEPKFENINDSFKITLFSSAFISSKDKTWLTQFEPFGLNERQHTALAHLRNNPSTGISNREYRDINSMNNVRDDKKANSDLKEMVRLSILISIGENRARRYIINPRLLVG